MQLTQHVPSREAMLAFGAKFGALLSGQEVIELVGDVGTGKTTFVKGLALGLGVREVVQSPTFTISRVYEVRHGLRLYHYDFYRLPEPGLMRDELAETLEDTKAIVVLEWDQSVQDILPVRRTMQLTLTYTEDGGRDLSLHVPKSFAHITTALQEAT